MNQTVEETKNIVLALKNENQVVAINSIKSKNDNSYDKINDNSIIISNKFYEGSKKYILDILNKFHKENPIAKGLKKEELKSILFKRYSKVGDTAFEDLINYFIENKVLKQIDDLISNFDFNVIIDDKKAKEITNIEKKYLDAAYTMPLTQEVVDEFAKVVNGKNNKLEIRQMIVDLAKDGKLVKLSNEYYIHKTHFDNALNVVNKLFENRDKITMPELRDKLGTSRKYAILIMDYLDQKRITKMIDDYRVKGDRFGKN